MSRGTWGVVLALAAACDAGSNQRCLNLTQALPGECVPVCPNGQERVAGECVRTCRQGEHRVGARCRSPSPLRTNTLGFLPTAEKLALTAIEPKGLFSIVDANDHVAFEGEPSGPHYNEDTDEELWSLDFSAFSSPGKYRVALGEATTEVLALGHDTFARALHATMLGYYGLRCGTAVSFEYESETYEHEACHTADGARGFSGEQATERIASRGGWHDAGDYGKYVANAAFSVGMLLLAWQHFQPALEQLSLEELPEHGGPVPDFLDEVRYELEWLLTMQTESGAVADKLTEANFGGFILPEHDSSLRALAPVSSEATADFAAVLARAARAYEPFDAGFAERCSTAAQHAYAFLRDNPERLPFDAEAAGFHTGRYNSSDEDDRLWAAFELWATTRDPDYLADFEGRALSEELSVSDAWDWTQVQNLAYFGYATDDSAGRDPSIVSGVEAAVLQSARTLVETSDAHGYGRAIGSRYLWGSNGILVRAVLNLGTADRLDPDPRYRQVALRQLDYLFGKNPYSRSFVTGLGDLPPNFPHHRPSAADHVTAPWPGLLVGGPNPGSASSGDMPEAAQVLPALSWQDVQASYWTNEVAINWNAPLVYALAWANTH